jgi:hypothetical protein
MSMPGPLPYEPKRFGSDRDIPAKAGMRPYLERLALADKLVEEAKVRPGDRAAWLPNLAQLLLVVGALAPFVLAIPGFGTLAVPLLVSTYPLSAGLLYATAWLIAGWGGAALVAVAGGAGLVASGVAGEPTTPEAARQAFRLRAVLVGLVALATAAAVIAFGWVDALNGSAGAVWVAFTAAAGLYGAMLTARRENWTGALLGAVALIAGGRVIIGSAALVALVMSDKAFPGQNVALYPWRRSQVSLDPIEPASTLEAEPNKGRHPLDRPPREQSLFIAMVSLLFGGFAPFVLALPWFGIELFGGLILAIFPLSVFILWTGASIQGAFIVLGSARELAPLVPGAVLILLWLLVLPAVGALIAARAVAGRRRRWAALAGSVLLVAGGRPFFGVGALVAVAYAWRLFDQPHEEEKAHEPPKEPTPGASAH